MYHNLTLIKIDIFILNQNIFNRTVFINRTVYYKKSKNDLNTKKLNNFKLIKLTTIIVEQKLEDRILRISKTLFTLTLLKLFVKIF